MLVKNADQPALKIHFLKTRPWKCDHGKRPYDMGQLHGPQCDQPLGYDIYEECRPTGFRNAFSGNRNVGVWLWSVTMEKGPMTWDNFVVHNVNNPCAMTFVKNTDRPTLKIHFFGKSDRETVTMGKCHMTWDNFVVHNVNTPFAMTFVKNADLSALKNTFFENRIVEVWPWSVTIEERPYDTGQLRGPPCKQPLCHDICEECQPISFKNTCFENPTVKAWPWSVTMEKRPYDTGQLRGP